MILHDLLIFSVILQFSFINHSCVPLQPRQLEQPVEKPNEVPTFEIWFPRLIVVPVYSQEVAGVRKEKERLTAALFLHSYTRARPPVFTRQ